MSALARDRLALGLVALGGAVFVAKVWAGLGWPWGIIGGLWVATALVGLAGTLRLARELAPLADRLDRWAATFGEGGR